MTTTEAENKIKKLREEINRHNYNYYVLNTPEITDKAFDMLLKELEALENSFPEFSDPLSPTQRLGSDLTNNFVHIAHKRPMMSLSNSYSIEEVDEWFERVKKALDRQAFSICAELKFDGTSISLTYRHGRLIRAVTRGDGEKGDDVTENVKTIRSIPLQLLPGNWPDEFEIRGEILMPWNVFEKLNEERAYNEEPLFANPRNAASGTLKMLDPRIVAKRHLDARFYYLLTDSPLTGSHYEDMLLAKSWGFKVSSNMKILHSLQEVDNFIDLWDTERKKLPVATDGLVFKVDSLRQQMNLGNTAKSPRWAIAYKFNPEQACTPLRFVSFETGRMGIVTPVANLEPVLLSGTIVKRASLHNEDTIQDLDIHDNDWLYVEKGGEIIPKITGVDKDKRAPLAKKIQFVKECPVCGTPLVRIPGESAWCCPNHYGCRPQITGKIEHFCARRMMNIDGIGEETAELLYDTGLVKTIADLYDLKQSDLSKLDRIGEKTAQRIIKGIKDSLNIPFERVIYSLSIPNVGETTAKRIASAVKNMDNMRAMSVEQLTSIPDIGPVIAQGIFNFLRDPVNIDNILRLAVAGVTMALADDKLLPAGNVLQGKTIVISGTFTYHSRDEYKEIIEQYQGKNAGSISKNTSFVLAGENMGPAKLEKCHTLEIPIVSENQFLEMLK